ncbi:hypothetical protein EVG20_g892 [Dentipellis fragilis]|uniref:DNA replication complex GINS protein PSF3 n=1 Tax=Dentipellis fragilis TaxID=205917 RepID=A0A4Y9ZBB9_9AGAM|nr:hypothetical protein EVG20_g892 [Dentipellis fragilis]
MEEDYYSVEAILAENQKIQCTFKVDIPDLGHLDGGNERDVGPLFQQCVCTLTAAPDKSAKQNTATSLDVLHPHIFVGICPTLVDFVLNYPSSRDCVDFTIPPPFTARVRNALNAEAKSVQLSGLVGAGGLWYGFGKSLIKLLDDAPANEMSDILTKTFKNRLVEVIDQAQHFAALGPAGGGQSGDVSQSFREGLDGTEREREDHYLCFIIPSKVTSRVTQYLHLLKKARNEQSNASSMAVRANRWIFPAVSTASESKTTSSKAKAASKTRRNVGLREDPGASMPDMNDPSESASEDSAEGAMTRRVSRAVQV